MKTASFEFLRKTIHDESGIVVNEDKMAMVAARLTKRVRSLGLANDEDYIAFLKENRKTEIVELLDVISTNVTRFYREDQHFKFLDEHLVDLLNAGEKRIRIWCAASSTGEEPYTLAITAQEALRKTGKQVDLKILATDISPTVLAHAQQGVYSEQNARPIPPELKDRYFDKVDGQFAAKDILKRMLVFRRVNLMDQPFPLKGPLDLIFCRNVMIYFNSSDRRKVVEGFCKLLTAEGRLVVGLSESLNGMGDVVERDGASIYRRVL